MHGILWDRYKGPTCLPPAFWEPLKTMRIGQSWTMANTEAGTRWRASCWSCGRTPAQEESHGPLPRANSLRHSPEASEKSVLPATQESAWHLKRNSLGTENSINYHFSSFWPKKQLSYSSHSHHEIKMNPRKWLRVFKNHQHAGPWLPGSQEGKVFSLRCLSLREALWCSPSYAFIPSCQECHSCSPTLRTSLPQGVTWDKEMHWCQWLDVERTETHKQFLHPRLGQLWSDHVPGQLLYPPSAASLTPFQVHFLGTSSQINPPRAIPRLRVRFQGSQCKTVSKVKDTLPITYMGPEELGVTGISDHAWAKATWPRPATHPCCSKPRGGKPSHITV